jgi:hypothetical protein
LQNPFLFYWRFGSRDLQHVNLFRLTNRFVRLPTNGVAVVTSVCRTDGDYFVGASHSVPGCRFGAFRICTSVPPRSNETSSITDFITKIPRPWSAPMFLVLHDDGNPLSQFTAAENLNQLVAVHTVAVNDCIV